MIFHKYYRYLKIFAIDFFAFEIIAQNFAQKQPLPPPHRKSSYQWKSLNLRRPTSVYINVFGYSQGFVEEIIKKKSFITKTVNVRRNLNLLK